jgi:hypothetical protein
MNKAMNHQDRVNVFRWIDMVADATSQMVKDLRGTEPISPEMQRALVSGLRHSLRDLNGALGILEEPSSPETVH